MTKDIEWLKEKIGDLPITDTVFISDGVSYIDSAVSVTSVYDLIDKLDEPEVLPVIPKYVADFIKVRKYTDAYSLQYIFCIAMERSEAEQLKKEYDWISANDETFVRAWLDGYEVEEEPLYYALVKGHELITDEGVLTCKYWNLNTSNGDVFPSNRLSEDGKFLIEMSKSEWNKLGINESNADFVKVEE